MNFDLNNIELNYDPDTVDKCELCSNSKCCTYITQQIDTPDCEYDFEVLLWQVSHQEVSAYKDDDGWFIIFETRCSHLQFDGRCGIYHDRPTICRTHSNDFCEYDVDAEEGFELYFPNYDSLLVYCKQRFNPWTTGNPPPE